jgi:alanine-synthesizing transaminase
VFSSRTGFSRQRSDWALGVERCRREGSDLLDLTRSNPTEVGIPYAGDAILRALGDARGLGYEPAPFGLPSARAAVARHFSERGLAVSTDRIVLTAGTSEGYGALFKLLCDPGDEVLVAAPSYPLLEHLAAFEAVRLVPYPLAYDGAWHVDVNAVRRARTARCRALVVVSPNNPTGSYLKRDELGALAELGLPIVSDEVFASYAFGEDERRARSALEAGDVLSFALGGLSKLAGLPQLKLAWMALGGPEAQVSEALGRLELIQDALLSVATPVQLALPSLFETRHVAEGAIRERCARNLRALERAVQGSAVTLLFAEGGWYATLRLPSTKSERDWVFGLLEAEGVLVDPGWLFDFGSEPYVVLSLLTPESDFSSGVERLVRHVQASA